MTSQELQDKIKEQIKKTGFVLEDKIVKILRKHGWFVISNKYYIDDLENSIREIDIVAYKCSKLDSINVFTSLIISCKKSDASIWALLSREINKKDPNTNFWPLHTWTNNKCLEYQTSRSDFSQNYHEGAINFGVSNALSLPDVEIFAFQEMAKSDGKPQNDKSIFGSITSLIKAQSYEKSILPNKNKINRIYQYNLISVVETDLLRVMFEDANITSTFVDDDHFLSQYIIKKEQTFSRIRFIKSECFEKHLSDYTKLHEFNCHHFKSEVDNFYVDVAKSQSKLDCLSEDLRIRLGPIIQERVLDCLGEYANIKDMWVLRVESKDMLCIVFHFSDEIIEFINCDNEIDKEASRALMQIYKYPGKFMFANEFPD